MTYIVLAIPAFLLTYVIMSTNGYHRLQNKCDESYSGIDVALSKRYNLITNLVETVKGYAKHEKETLELVTSLRNMDKSDFTGFNDSLDQARAQLFLLIENYPTIKADTNFLHLQKSLTDVEEHLQAARRLHNRNVTDYNTYIMMSPRNLIPLIKNASPRPLFQAEVEERENVRITN